MDTLKEIQSLQQLSDLASGVPLLSPSHSVKAYYDSTDQFLKNGEKAHYDGAFDAEYFWLMRYLVLICERIPQHPQYNKGPEAQKLRKIYQARVERVFPRVEVLKSELVAFYQQKVAQLEARAKEQAASENPKAKITNATIPTEADLLARLSRLSIRPAQKSTPTSSTDASSQSLSEPSTPKAPEPEVLDLSCFDRPKASTTSSDASNKEKDLRLIPEVEIKDESLDLSWLEDDPLFGSRNRKVVPLPSSAKNEDPVPYPSLDMSVPLDPRMNPLKPPAAKTAPPAYNEVAHSNPATSTPVVAVPSTPHVVLASPSVPTSSAPATKYSVITVSNDDPAPSAAIQPIPAQSRPPSYIQQQQPRSTPSISSPVAATPVLHANQPAQAPISLSPYSVPASYSEHSPSFSVTQTIRGQQFDPEAMNKRLLNTTVGATCSEYLPEPGQPPSSAPVKAPSPSPAPSTGASSSSGGSSKNAAPSQGATPMVLVPASSLAGHGASPVSGPPFVLASPPQLVAGAGNNSHYLYQPAPNVQSKLPVLGNVPVVFRPNQLNMFDPSRAAPSASGVSAAAAAPVSAVAPKASSRPPKYAKPASSPQTTPPPPGKTSSPAAKSSATPVIMPNTSAFPLLTNQRPAAAVADHSLRNVEMDGDMFDKFMAAAHRNTARAIETCGILAGKYLPNKECFRVTHLIIPKQTGTTDTCATTNEDEIFDYQIKNDLLTLGWIHTHPTQACFLSSVDLHTHCSYQSLFPEAVAVVIAPRDTPNFAFFHLSNGGFNIVQSCPLTGFHHHGERGLYQACSHVALAWNPKKPCKIVDMR